VGGLLGAILTPILGNPIAGFAIAGAITGAIFGAIDGGLDGALKGAAWGFVIGGAFGALGGMDPTGLLLPAAMIGGGVYAGATGGTEGLANYTAGSLGTMLGSSLGEALIGESPVNTGQAENQEGALGEAQIEVEKDILEGNIVEAGDDGRALGNGSPAENKFNGEVKIAEAAAEGDVGRGDYPGYSRRDKLVRFRESKAGGHTRSIIKGILVGGAAVIGVSAIIGTGGGIVFGAGCVAFGASLKVYFFSDRPWRDAIFESGKAAVGSKVGVPYNYLSDWIMDALYEPASGYQ